MKILAVVTVLIMAFSLVACGSSTTPAAPAAAKPTAAATVAPVATAAPAAELVVAGVVFQDDQFMKSLTQGYKDAAAKAGVKCLTGNTANDQAKEVELINTYMTQKVNGLAIAPLDPKTSEPALKKASDSGMKISITNMDLSSAPYIVGGYTSDNENIGAGVGAAAAKFVTEKLGGKAKIGILQFKSQVPAQSKARVDGFKSAFKDMPGVEFVADQDAWLTDKAVIVAGDMLTANPGINVIFGANDGGTKGATLAVKNAGKAGKIYTFGIDVDQQVIDFVKSPDNILQAANGQDPYQMGYKAMETLIKSLKGEDVSASAGKTEIVPGKLVNRADPASIK